MRFDLNPTAINDLAIIKLNRCLILGIIKFWLYFLFCVYVDLGMEFK